MKTRKFLIPLIIAVSFYFTSFSQSWNVSGNSTIDSTNFIGTTSNQNLLFKTNNIVRLLIDKEGLVEVKNNLNVENGWIRTDSIRCRSMHVGDSSLFIGSVLAPNSNIIASTSFQPISFVRQTPIGTYNSSFQGVNIGTTSPSYLLHIHDSGGGNNGAFVHLTNNTTGQTNSDGFLLGIASNGTADVLQRENRPIRFWINNTEYMHIQGNSPSTNGFIGIGSGFTNPAFLLDLLGGDINVSTPTNGYRIGTGSLNSKYVLRHNNILSNIYVGVNAGNSTATGINNTLVGSNAGNNLTNGSNVTFIGSGAGQNMTTCGSTLFNNTFVGANAGFINVQGQYNTFLGNQAGYSNTVNYNTFVGDRSGLNNSIGTRNTFLGYFAGAHNGVGNDDCYIGSHSAFGIGNSTGSRNNFIGSECGADEITGNDNELVGYKAGNQNSVGSRNVLIGTLAGSNIGNGVTIDNDDIFIGFHSGQSFTGGGNNILIGSNTIANNNISNSTAIGDGAVVLGSNQLILGNNVNVGIGMSNVAGGPQNLLELNTPSTFNTPNSAGGTGNSGLRFRDLTQNSTPQSSNGLALSVDANGDVILVPDQVGGSAGPSLGNPCNSSPVPLNTDWEIPFVDPSNPGIQNSMYMSGQSDMSANNPADLGIGYTCGTPLQAKLDVYNYTNNTASPITPFYTNAYAGRFIHDGNYNDIAGTTDMVGIFVESNVVNNYLPNGHANSVINQSRNIGTQSIALGNAIYNIGSLSETKQHNAFKYMYGTGALGLVTGSELQGDGVLGLSYGNTMNVGVHGVAALSINGPNANVSTFTSIGGLFMAYDPKSGAFSEKDNAHFLNSGLGLAGAHIGVYGGVENSSSSSINTTSLTGLYAGVYGEAASKSNYWAGYFNGNVGTTGGFFQVSDSIVKTNVVNLKSDSSLHILAQLHPKTYTLDSVNYPTLGLNNQPQIGLFAQEVERVIPSAVRLIHHPATVDSIGNIITAAYDVKGLNYLELIPVLVSAIKSLDSTNKSLQNQINTITAAQTGARSAAASPSNAVAKGTEVHLSDLEIVLNQNSPNPFAEQTIISYIIPDNVKDANIVFYTLGGTVLKNIRINERGQGQMTVYAENLSAGMYTYSLIADGNIVATKKMICEKK